MSEHESHQQMAAALRALNLEESFRELHHFSRPAFASKPPTLKRFCQHCDGKSDLRKENAETIARATQFVKHIQAGMSHEKAMSSAWHAHPIVER